MDMYKLPNYVNRMNFFVLYNLYKSENQKLNVKTNNPDSVLRTGPDSGLNSTLFKSGLGYTRTKLGLLILI